MCAASGTITGADHRGDQRRRRHYAARDHKNRMFVAHKNLASELA
jgi:hypothetical protein